MHLRLRKIRNLASLCLAALAHPQHGAVALELQNDAGWSIRWDNTLRYSNMVRLEGPDAALIANPNADDGNRNFRHGIVSNRYDLLSQLSISKNNAGLELSVAAWYDTAYHGNNLNNSPATFNSLSVPHNVFPRETRTLHGGHAEIFNAFVYGSRDIGGLPFSFRLGRHTLLWGESLFFSENAIAAGQAPVDYIKALTNTGSYSRDVYMPVAQASGSLQLRNGITLEGYYQFEWRKNREPGAGSYFSTDDHYYEGGERFIQRPGQYLFHTGQEYPTQWGQFGLAAKWTGRDVDYGLYALRFNAKNPEFYIRRGINRATGAVLDPSIVDLSIGKAGTYSTVYPQGTEIYGFSASFYAGDSNVAMEVSARRNTPLASDTLFVPAGVLANATHNSVHPVGDTLHAQVSAISPLGRGRFWDNATINAELALSQRLTVSKNPAAVDPSTGGTALSIQATFEPQYFGVLPNLTLGPIIGVRYAFLDNPAIYSRYPADAGFLNFGITATYRAVWSASLVATHFIGRQDVQRLADRDFLRLSIQRTF
jgi:Protein of unknown function (DUF1302)